MNEPTPIPGLELETQVDEGVETRRLRGAVGGALFGKASTSTPTRLGRFFILDRLGEGGMGTVYRGFDPDLDRMVAIKLVREFGRDPEQSRARVLREAQALARLSHPNVVTVYEVGSTDDGVHVVMELVEGGDLYAWARAHPPGGRARFEQAFDLLLAAGTGLSAAHAAGLIHRDFKPKNVLIGGDGRARVADFGLARSLEGAPIELPAALASSDARRDRSSADQGLTQAGAVVGTPLYMSPEQLAAGEVDARTDQYSFCVSAIEVLFGRRPFEGTSLGELIDGKASGRVDPLPDVDVPGWVMPLLRRGLAGDPADRHADMDTLLAALVHARGRRRRRMMASGIGLGAIGLLAALSGEPTHTASAFERCELGAGRLGEWWDDLRPRVESRLDGLGASDRADAVGRAMDRHLHAWEAAFAETCTRTWVEGDASPVAFDLRMQCLRGIESETTAVFEPWLAGGVDDTRPLDPRAVHDLSDPSRCLRLDTSRVTLPEEAAARAQIEALELEVARARAAFLAGRTVEASEILDAVEPRVREAGYAPLVARMDFVMGRVLESTGDAATSRQRLEASFHAATAGFDDDTAIEAAVGLARHYGYIEVDAEHAREWARHAQALVERSDAPADTRAALARVRGWTEMVDGKLEAAERVLTDAIEELGDEPDLDPIELALLHSDRAPVVDRLGDLDAAREELERSLVVLEQAFGHDNPALGPVHLNLSSTLMEMGELDAAREHAVRSLEIKIAEAGEGNPSTNGPLANLAEVERRAGHLDQALRHAERAVEVTADAPEFEYDHMLDTNNLGVIYLELERLDDAERMLRQAVALADRVLGEHHPTAALHRGNLAETIARAGNYAEATALSERAVADLELALGIDLVGYPEQLEIRAEIAGYRGDHEAALADAQRLLARHRKLAASAEEIARGQAHVGLALAALGRSAEAEQVLDEALAVLTVEDAGDLVGAARVVRAELARADGDLDRARALVTGIEGALPPATHPWGARLRERHRVLVARLGTG